jgi:uncharacterized protein
MKIKKYSSADDFLADNHKFLYKKEAANNLMIGITEGMRGMEIQDDVLLSSITEGADTLLVSLLTPPRDLLMVSKEVNAKIIALLIDDLIAQNAEVPGILAESSTADLFCDLWQKRTGANPTLFRRERIHQLLKCREIKISSGYMRLACEADVDQIAGWIAQFHVAINEHIDPDAAKKMAESKIQNEKIFVWDLDNIVSMCASARESINGKTINLVYTPPENRSHGYATSCVYSLCRQILGEGKKFCSLFTDLDNPTSNSIYGKIGFEPVLDYLHYRFQ